MSGNLRLSPKPPKGANGAVVSEAHFPEPLPRPFVKGAFKRRHKTSSSNPNKHEIVFVTKKAYIP
jgi:hypothetical protein